VLAFLGANPFTGHGFVECEKAPVHDIRCGRVESEGCWSRHGGTLRSWGLIWTIYTWPVPGISRGWPRCPTERACCVSGMFT